MYQSVLSELSKLSAAKKYEEVKDNVYLYKKSLYVIGKDICAEVDFSSFTETEFKRPIYMPMSGNFEESDDVSDEVELGLIHRCTRQLNKHCDTLVFFKKDRIVEFISESYGSFAKLNKMVANIDISDKIFMSFSPVKKSTSVFEGKFDESIIIMPRPRIRYLNASISVKLLPLFMALNNLLLADMVKLEVDKNCEFVRVSCFYNGLRVKFSVLNSGKSNF